MSERQRDAHCGFAYFVGEHAILDRASQHHTSNASLAIARARDRAICPITLHCLLKNVDHDPEDGFKCLPNTVLLAQKVGRKSDQGAGSVDILEMLARKIVADELSRRSKARESVLTPSLLKSCFSSKSCVTTSA
ncbi:MULTISPECIES: hypothetical protein [Bradyrhizobium]|uniref:hypothetical protein n=1 Tax=Bradyrhizobium elkanii TaxID=29448 RepID=UPI001FDA1892|nr:hypothetical protein [Bradyrhizobium elkanii]